MHCIISRPYDKYGTSQYNINTVTFLLCLSRASQKTLEKLRVEINIHEYTFVLQHRPWMLQITTLPLQDSSYIKLEFKYQEQNKNIIQLEKYQEQNKYIIRYMTGL